jgi:hypothetical protein
VLTEHYHRMHPEALTDSPETARLEVPDYGPDDPPPGPRRLAPLISFAATRPRLGMVRAQ